MANFHLKSAKPSQPGAAKRRLQKAQLARIQIVYVKCGGKAIARFCA